MTRHMLPFYPPFLYILLFSLTFVFLSCFFLPVRLMKAPLSKIDE